MKMYRILSCLVIIGCNIQYGITRPTFGDEFVHIKLHVPKEAAVNAKTNLEHIEQHYALQQHPGSYPTEDIVIRPPKVIHHYHHSRRRPYGTHSKKHLTKSKENSLIESVVVTQLKHPESTGHLDFLNHAEDIAEHIVKPIEYKPKIKTIDTYHVVEEHHPKPKPHVETIKVIETKEPATYQSHGYRYEHPSSHVEAIKLVDSKESSHYHKPTSHKEETIKVSDYHEHSGHNYVHAAEEPTHHYHGNYKTSTYAKEPKYTYHAPSPNSGYNYDTSVKSTGSSRYQYESSIKPSSSNGYEYEPPSNSVRLVETRPPTSYGPYEEDAPKHEFSYSKTHNRHKQYQYEHDTGFTPFIKSTNYNYEHPQHDEYETKPKYSSSSHDNDYSIAVSKELVPPHVTPAREFYDTNYKASDTQNFDYSREMDKLSEKYIPPSNSNEWKPELSSGYKVAETYTGYDSYSANHVQGLGSGGYKYPAVFL